MPLKRKRDGTFARLDPLARGQIWGMHLAHVPREDIQKQVRKKDGTPPSLHAIDEVIASKNAQPDWRGQDSSAGGRPSARLPKQKKQLLQLSLSILAAEKGPRATAIFPGKREGGGGSGEGGQGQGEGWGE